MPDYEQLYWLPGERVLAYFDWHTPEGLPATAVATTRRILGWGEVDLGLDPRWWCIYDFTALPPAQEFHQDDNYWWLDLGAILLRRDLRTGVWEEQ